MRLPLTICTGVRRTSRIAFEAITTGSAYFVVLCLINFGLHFALGSDYTGFSVTEIAPAMGAFTILCLSVWLMAKIVEWISRRIA